jgi:hypothetical protein
MGDGRVGIYVRTLWDEVPGNILVLLAQVDRLDRKEADYCTAVGFQCLGVGARSLGQDGFAGWRGDLFLLGDREIKNDAREHIAVFEPFKDLIDRRERL